MKAIEATGVVKGKRQLQLDEPLPADCPHWVRVIILIPEDDEVSESMWIKAAASNPAFDFLKNPAEDIYSLTDGKPFHDQG